MQDSDDFGGNFHRKNSSPMLEAPETSESDSALAKDKANTLKKSRGRPKISETLFLDSFIIRNKKSFKKDNIRTKLIRGHNKTLKMCRKHLEIANDEDIEMLPSSRFFDSKTPDCFLGRSLLQKLNFNDEFERKLWMGFLENYKQDAAFLQVLSNPKFGPATERKDKNIWKHQTYDFRSFNNYYCREYFEDERARRSFKKYLNLVFADREPQELCDRFGMDCCDSTAHEAGCSAKWQDLKNVFGMTAFMIGFLK